MANIQGLVINGSVIKNDGETSGDIDLEKPYKIGKIGDNDVYEVWVCNQLNPLKYDPQYFYNKIIDCSDIPNFTYISLLFSELITNYTEVSNECNKRSSIWY